MITHFGEHRPEVAENTFVAPNAWIIGDVTLEEEVSVFFGSVLRGDILPIRVGARTNIQEHCMIHTSHGRSPAIIGSDATIGHRAIIHGAAIGTRTLIGMGAIVLDDTVVEDECLVAAGSIITERKHIPARSLVMGVPGKVVKRLGEADIKGLQESADSYVQTGRDFIELFSQ